MGGHPQHAHFLLRITYFVLLFVEKEITHEKLNLMKWRKNGEKKTCRLKEGMSEKWREIGQNVGISDAILGGYWTSYHDNQECINSVITEWIRKTSVEVRPFFVWAPLKKRFNYPK